MGYVSHDDALKQECTRCHAKPGQECVRKDSDKAQAKGRVHKERMRAARAVRVPAKARVRG